jgi:hypothetical protein
MNNDIWQIDDSEFIGPKRTGKQSCDLGTVAELEFLTQAKRRGWNVFVPIGHATPADAVIFAPPSRPISVQIKKGMSRGAGRGYKAMVGSGRSLRAMKHSLEFSKFRRYEARSFDVLAMYVEDVQGFVFWTLQELLQRGKTWAMWTPGKPCHNWEIFEQFCNE